MQRPRRRTCKPPLQLELGLALDYGEPDCIAFAGLRVDDAADPASLSVVHPAAQRPEDRPRQQLDPQARRLGTVELPHARLQRRARG